MKVLKEVEMEMGRVGMRIWGRAESDDCVVSGIQMIWFSVVNQERT